ncbi:hypothetical protein CK203_065290 [Vitis vinifera]|uniref:Retrotransposon Copia-like N-terminal domain-containing protein n=1 Tax=Vitis vinifera TaxID=29760 RepID=A0A438H4Z9_VITVI|nr:hypothetical protein CK203_065290 [Vitis vinifera]
MATLMKPRFSMKSITHSPCTPSSTQVTMQSLVPPPKGRQLEILASNHISQLLFSPHLSNLSAPSHLLSGSIRHFGLVEKQDARVGLQRQDINESIGMAVESNRIGGLQKLLINHVENLDIKCRHPPSLLTPVAFFFKPQLSLFALPQPCPPIKLDRSNYILWKTQMENVVYANGFEDYIEGTKSCPPKELPTGDLNPDFVQWRRFDRMVLVGCIPP